MGQARETMDRITDALVRGDGDALGRLYATDAVADSPDAGRLQGGAAIVEYMMGFRQAFPDMTWEPRYQYESGDTAIDEGWIVGTHQGVLSSPEGEIPATGRSIRLRECDVLTVRDGVGVEHRMYYDQLDLASQLGLGERGAAVPSPRADADRTSRTSAR